MKHWWVRFTKGYARNQIVYECSHCRTRKKHVPGVRGGSTIAVRVPGSKTYTIGPVPPCYEVKRAY